MDIFHTKQRNSRNKRTFLKWKTFQVSDDDAKFRRSRFFVCFVLKNKKQLALQN